MPAAHFGKFTHRQRGLLSIWKRHSHGEIGYRQIISDEPFAALEVVVQHGGKSAEPGEGLLDGGPIRAAKPKRRLTTCSK